MRVGEAIRKRRSIRKWQDRPVPRRTLERLLDAARLAPSGKNGQQWEIVCVTERARLRELVPACGGQEHVGQPGRSSSSSTTRPRSGGMSTPLSPSTT